MLLNQENINKIATEIASSENKDFIMIGNDITFYYQYSYNKYYDFLSHLTNKVEFKMFKDYVCNIGIDDKIKEYFKPYLYDYFEDLGLSFSLFMEDLYSRQNAFQKQVNYGMRTTALIYALTRTALVKHKNAYTMEQIADILRFDKNEDKKIKILKVLKSSCLFREDLKQLINKELKEVRRKEKVITL